jgi:HD-like signal output (HDOD) protein
MKNNLISAKTIGYRISLEILTSKIKLPPLPTNGAKLLNMAQQPMENIDIASFAKLVEGDPGLFTMVIQLANSPYYAGVDKIISLRSAITRIGLQEAIDSICLYFFQKMLPKFPGLEGFSSKEYWAYSWACAMANRRLGHPNLGMDILPGELYIAGLLHGIGKLLMAIHYPNEFSKCLVNAKKLNQPLYKMELEEFGTTDAYVASKIMEVWNLPDNICAGVAFYQRPESAPSEYQTIAGLTQFAYCISGMSGIGTSGDGVLMDLSSTYICKQTDLPISRKKIQENLVQEILKSLDEKSESVTGLSPDSQNKAIEKQGLKETQKSSKKTPLPKPKKKGWFGWIRSLLGKN